jgi:hypothetical protein
MENHTAKHFVLQLGSLLSLYCSIAFLLTLLFGCINVMYPDAINGYWEIESSQSQIRLGIAMVLVFFPTYILLTRAVNKLRRTETNGAYLTLTKWLVYLSLLVGGGVILGDLVAVIMAFLEGELTQRFILKAFSVLLVVGAAFHYYILDARGYWLTKERSSGLFAIGAGLVVLAALGLGFTLAGSPTKAREVRLDARQITDLQTIQWYVESYITTNKQVPASLEVLGQPIPVAPEGRPAYTYVPTTEGFELCATFAHASPPTDIATLPVKYTDQGITITNTNDWNHAEGFACFARGVQQTQ